MLGFRLFEKSNIQELNTKLSLRKLIPNINRLLRKKKV